MQSKSLFVVVASFAVLLVIGGSTAAAMDNQDFQNYALAYGLVASSDLPQPAIATLVSQSIQQPTPVTPMEPSHRVKLVPYLSQNPFGEPDDNDPNDVYTYENYLAWDWDDRHLDYFELVHLAYDICFHVTYEPLLVERTRIKLAIQKYLRHTRLGNLATAASDRERREFSDATSAWAKVINDKMDKIVHEAHAALLRMLDPARRANAIKENLYDMDDETNAIKENLYDMDDEIVEHDEEKYRAARRELIQLSVDAKARLIAFRDAAYIERVKEVARPFVAAERMGGAEEMFNKRKRKMDQEAGEEEEDDS